MFLCQRDYSTAGIPQLQGSHSSRDPGMGSNEENAGRRSERKKRQGIEWKKGVNYRGKITKYRGNTTKYRGKITKYRGKITKYRQQICGTIEIQLEIKS